MAGATTRLAIPQAQTWTKLTDGPFNVLVKVDPGPDVEAYYGATASAPTADSQGLPIVAVYEPLSVNVKTGDSLWLRCTSRETNVRYMKQDA